MMLTMSPTPALSSVVVITIFFLILALSWVEMVMILFPILVLSLAVDLTIFFLMPALLWVVMIMILCPTLCLVITDVHQTWLPTPCAKMQGALSPWVVTQALTPNASKPIRLLLLVVVLVI
jgi:hypothetical protein